MHIHSGNQFTRAEPIDITGVDQPMHATKKNSFQKIQLTENEYNTHPFLDVRIYVKGEGGKYYPTRQAWPCGSSA